MYNNSCWSRSLATRDIYYILSTLCVHSVRSRQDLKIQQNMYRELRKTSATPDRQEPRTRSTRSTPGGAPGTDMLSSKPLPRRDAHSAPALSTGQNVSPRSAKFNSAASHAPHPFVHTHTATPAEDAAVRLRNLQKRFIKATTNLTTKPMTRQSWDEDDNRTSEDAGLDRLDRRAVIDIYDQALDALSKSPWKHNQTGAECTYKTRVVLGITKADPEDSVFETSGQLLKPIDPQYAEPRIERTGDENGYRAQWRLDAWRREGWPEVYPANAIRKEAEEMDEMLVGKNSISDGQIMSKMHNEAQMWEEVDYTSLLSTGKKAAKIAEKARKATEKKAAKPGNKPNVARMKGMAADKSQKAKKKSKLYSAVVVDDTKKKKRGSSTGQHQRVEIHDTSDITTSSDDKEDSEDEDEDGDDWEY